MSSSPSATSCFGTAFPGETSASASFEFFSSDLTHTLIFGVRGKETALATLAAGARTPSSCLRHEHPRQRARALLERNEQTISLACDDPRARPPLSLKTGQTTTMTTIHKHSTLSENLTHVALDKLGHTRVKT